MTQLNCEEGQILPSGAAVPPVGASPFTLVLEQCSGAGESLGSAMNKMNHGTRASVNCIQK